jgi:hypothetical protein
MRSPNLAPVGFLFRAKFILILAEDLSSIRIHRSAALFCVDGETAKGSAVLAFQSVFALGTSL